ncbi:MAG TPA: IS6 family transposase, partial [Candidatus Nanopusillus sp.]|nr:IS6 family transposase [Candidatus Nanopusillus sp.]
MGNERIYVWVAIDVDTKECLAVSKGRSRIEVYTFLKKIL